MFELWQDMKFGAYQASYRDEYPMLPPVAHRGFGKTNMTMLNLIMWALPAWTLTNIQPCK